MLFVIHAVDKPGALDTRLLNYDDHKAFLSDTSAFGVRIVMSGPLTADDGSTMIGSLPRRGARPRRGRALQRRRSVPSCRHLGARDDHGLHPAPG